MYSCSCSPLFVWLRMKATHCVCVCDGPRLDSPSFFKVHAGGTGKKKNDARFNSAAQREMRSSRSSYAPASSRGLFFPPYIVLYYCYYSLRGSGGVGMRVLRGSIQLPCRLLLLLSLSCNNALFSFHLICSYWYTSYIQHRWCFFFF